MKRDKEEGTLQLVPAGLISGANAFLDFVVVLTLFMEPFSVAILSVIAFDA